MISALIDFSGPMLGELVVFFRRISGALVRDHHRFGFSEGGVAPANLHVLHAADALDRAKVFDPQEKSCGYRVVFGRIDAMKINLAGGLPFAGDNVVRLRFLAQR